MIHKEFNMLISGHVSYKGEEGVYVIEINPDHEFEEGLGAEIRYIVADQLGPALIRYLNREHGLSLEVGDMRLRGGGEPA